LTEDATSKFVVAVQDHFGKAFRRLSYLAVAGDVFDVKIFHADPRHAVNGSGNSTLRGRVLAAVHPNTVRAVLRRSNSRFKQNPLARGYWYEVICD
jgi:hypothetical protein